MITTGDLDRLVADYLYNLQGDSWAWKELWITENFLHKGGRSFSMVFAIIILSLLLISYFQNLFTPFRKTLLFVFVATLGSCLLISILKSVLAVSCPWEFERYGGHIFYQTVFEQLYQRTGAGCFPAGHASAGYAWLSLYFAGLLHQSKWRWLGLFIPLCLGAIFGVTQQIRGAHFISHDLWSLGICWLFSSILFLFFFKGSVIYKSVLRGFMYESSST